MHIEFRDKKLKKCYQSEKERKKALQEKADRFYNLIKKLEAMENSHELFTQHKYLRPHPWEDGRTSLDITGNSRLMFFFKKDEKNEEYIEIDEIYSH